MRILFVFGTRPEAIKMCTLIKVFKANNFFKVSVAVTGQHRHMLDQVLELFSIKPDFDLNVMKSNQDLFDITSSVLLGMKEVIRVCRPDLVLVHGDTTTTLAVTLSSFYSKVKVGHVEAGLRTYNFESPWPEEANRQLTTKLANYHFAPTERNREALLKEGIDESTVVVTGNTVIDSLLWMSNKIDSSDTLRNKIESELLQSGFDILENKRPFILVTGHRRENFGSGFDNICIALKKLAISFPTVRIVYPVHLNPNVQAPVQKHLSNLENVHLIKPLGYESFVYLMKKCFFVLTDSGGIQEEAPSLGKPVLVMRDTTERFEAVDSGTVKLVGTSVEKIYKECSNLILDVEAYKLMANAKNPYGDGEASMIIAEYIERIFSEQPFN